MKLIKNIQIDTSDIPHSGATRILDIFGDVGASFSVRVSWPVEGNYYNFKTQSASVESSETVFKGTIVSGSVSIPIKFPDLKATSGYDSYEWSVGVHANAHLETEIDSSISNDKYFLSQTLTQLENRVVTFHMKNSSDSFTTVTSLTSTGNNASNFSTTLVLDQTITNTATDAAGFGLRLIRQPVETDFMFLSGDTVNGAITSSNEVKVDDLTDIGVGMIIHSITSGTLVGTPTVLAIDEDNKILTLSSAQTFSDGITLNFRAIGLDAIRNATGVDFTFEKLSVTASEISKTVRTTASGTTVALNGTYGIAGGGHVTISGVNIVNTAANTVQEVVASSSAGSMVMEVAQTVKAGSKIYFHGCTDTIKLKGSVTISKYPTKNQSIYLIIDNFITAGADS